MTSLCFAITYWRERIDPLIKKLSTIRPHTFKSWIMVQLRLPSSSPGGLTWVTHHASLIYLSADLQCKLEWRFTMSCVEWGILESFTFFPSQGNPLDHVEKPCKRNKEPGIKKWICPKGNRLFPQEHHKCNRKLCLWRISILSAFASRTRVFYVGMGFAVLHDTTVQVLQLIYAIATDSYLFCSLHQQLITDEPVGAQDFREITHHFRGIYRIYLNLLKKNPDDVNM